MRFTMQIPPSMVRVNNDTVDWTLTDPERIAEAPESIDWVTKGEKMLADHSACLSLPDHSRILA